MSFSVWRGAVLLQVRIIIYKKGLEDVISIKTPAAFGGLKSPEYLALNPQGKMPTLIFPAGGDPIPESEVPSHAFTCGAA